MPCRHSCTGWSFSSFLSEPGTQPVWRTLVRGSWLGQKVWQETIPRVGLMVPSRPVTDLFLFLGAQGFMAERFFKIGIALCSCCAFWASSAYAWNATGHRLVVHVAWKELSPAARSQIGRLLARHPDYARWSVAGTPSGDADLALLAEASLWADEIRRDSRFSAPGEEVSAQTGFPDMQKHSNWHYADEQEGPGDDNLYAALPRLYAQLADTSKPSGHRAYALVWLLHLVADAHQPLHNGFRDDRGGNDVAVVVWDVGGNRNASLHAFWDDLPGRGKIEGTALLQRVEALLVSGKTVSPGRLDFSYWQSENLRLSRQYAYPASLASQPIVLTRDFVDRAQRLANRQLVLAGQRLALLLETALTGGTRTPFRVVSPPRIP